MQVLKFGGTSVGSPERMQKVANLIDNGTPKIVVLSAVSGTTNKLLEISTLATQRKIEQAIFQLTALREEYRQFVNILLSTGELRSRGHEIVASVFGSIDQLIWGREFGIAQEKITLAQGELISTQLFQLFLEAQGIESALLPALSFMRLDHQGEPDLKWIADRLDYLLPQHANTNYFITQGYICLNASGEIDNLQRGGSDYTATLIGAAIQAEEIQIWTDIDGIHNNDPRIVEGTWPIRQVSYREAAELAYFGAKILHPTCVIPAEEKQVPILLKNTFEPDAPGTLISNASSGRAVTAIAAKDGITAIKIQSGRMLNAYGFLRKVFEAFEEFSTPIDMITTSEVSVSLTIDNTTHLSALLKVLRSFGEVSCDSDHTIICIVGDSMSEHTGMIRYIFEALEDVPVRMVSYGGSNNNISVLVPRAYKEESLRRLNQKLFQTLTQGAYN